MESLGLEPMICWMSYPWDKTVNQSLSTFMLCISYAVEFHKVPYHLALLGLTF